MKILHGLGLGVLLGCVSLVSATGTGPKKEDIPKYIKQLQTSTSAAERNRS